MIRSSAEIIGFAQVAAANAAKTLKDAEPNPINTTELLAFAEAKLTSALAEVRAARWGVERLSPSFDQVDLTLLLTRETWAIKAGRGLIPGYPMPEDKERTAETDLAEDR